MSTCLESWVTWQPCLCVDCCVTCGGPFLSCLMAIYLAGIEARLAASFSKKKEKKKKEKEKKEKLG